MLPEEQPGLFQRDMPPPVSAPDAPGFPAVTPDAEVEHAVATPEAPPEVQHIIAPRAPGPPPPPRRGGPAMAGNFLDWSVGEKTPIQKPAQQAQPTLLEQAYTAYPRLKSYAFQFKDSVGAPEANGRLLETYPADESWNPMPGKPTIERFSPNVTAKDVLGETLHILPRIDPVVGGMRKQFIDSMTGPQKQKLQEQYQYAQQNAGEQRSFEQWRDTSGYDAWFRGHITGQWPDQAYTPEQLQLFKGLEGYLKGDEPPQPQTGKSPSGAKYHPYESQIRQLAAAANDDPRFVALAVGVLKGESSAGNPNETSSKDARGPMQVIPSTFWAYRPENGDINNPAHINAAGVNYLSFLWDRYNGDPRKVAAAYNMGETRFNRGGVWPKETQAYVPKVMEHMRAALDEPEPSAPAPLFKQAGPPVPIQRAAAPPVAAPAAPATPVTPPPPAQPAAPNVAPAMARGDPATVQKNQAAVQQILRDHLSPVGIGETVIEAMTGLIAAAPAAVSGMMVALDQKDPQAYAQAFHAAQDAWTTHPHSAEGKALSENVAKVFGLLRQAGNWLGDKNIEIGRMLDEVSGIPYKADAHKADALVSALLTALPEALAMFAGTVKGKGGPADIPEATAPTVEISARAPQPVEPWQRLEPSMQGAGPSPSQMYGGPRVEPSADPSRVPDAALGTEPQILAPRAPEPSTPAPAAPAEPSITVPQQGRRQPDWAGPAGGEPSITVPQQGRTQIDEGGPGGEPRVTVLPDEVSPVAPPEPPLKPGHVRLYRAEYGGPKASIPEWIKEGQEHSGHAAAAGRWYVADRSMLDFYVKDIGKNAKVTYVDVPAAEVEKFRVSNTDQTVAGRTPASFSKDPGSEFFLPKEWADKRQPLEPPPDAAVPAPASDTGVLPWQQWPRSGQQPLPMQGGGPAQPPFGLQPPRAPALPEPVNPRSTDYGPPLPIKGKRGGVLVDDPRLQDEGVAQQLRTMASRAGWDTQGGRLLRDSDGVVIGRTRWNPVEEWFQTMQRDKKTRMKPADLKAALEKVLRGEKVTPQEARAVKFLLDENERIEASFKQIEAEHGPHAHSPDDVLDSLHVTDLPATHQNLLDLSLIDRARALDEDAFQRIPDQLSDTDYMAAVRRIIDEKRATEKAPAGEPGVEAPGAAPAGETPAAPTAGQAGGVVPQPHIFNTETNTFEPVKAAKRKPKPRK